jgi:signal transduction histidine kinase
MSPWDIMMQTIIDTLTLINPPLAVTAVLINLSFALLVLLRTSRRMFYMLFLLICLSVMGWNICTYVLYTTSGDIWRYISMVFSTMIPPFMFHFVVLLVRPNRDNHALLLPAYFFSGILACISLLALYYSGFRSFVENGYWDIGYLIVLAPFFLSGLLLVLNVLKRSEAPNEKSRLRYILAAGIAGVIAALTDHLQGAGMTVPALGHVGSVIYPSILAVGVFRHSRDFDILAQTRSTLEALNVMAAGLAHEIRNPITAIQGACRLLERRMSGQETTEQKKYLGIIIEEADRLNSILVNFQYFTRPVCIEKGKVSLNSLLRKTADLFTIDMPQVTVTLDLDDDPTDIQGDAVSLKQVFLNLLKNAAESADHQGEVRIWSMHQPPWIKVIFSDNGSGIPPEHLSRIFDPFFSTRDDGIGVGLTVSRKIIEAHGGAIYAENLLPHGAQFTILLPG